mgnify:CR=1 FL=1
MHLELHAADLLREEGRVDEEQRLALADLPRAAFSAMLETNLAAPFDLARRVAPGMIARGWGRIVNVSSIAGQIARGDVAYTASKGGLDALTHAMAVSLGPDIRVNAIRPGWIETRNWQKEADREKVEHREQDKAQHPAGRVGKPADIAHTVDWLIGAGFVTGQAINVDGGMTRTMIYEH